MPPPLLPPPPMLPLLQGRGTCLSSNQVQYSLLYRAPETNGVMEACK